MRLTTTIALVGALCFVGASLADEKDKKTEITVNETILVPGKQLPPGKYVMRLLPNSTDRHIVQIYNEDMTQLQATILAFANERVQRTGDTVLTYWETPAGSPPALRAWFWPGDTVGQEFAYPKEMAERIARANNNAPVASYTAQGEVTPETLAKVEITNQPGGTARTSTSDTAARADATPTREDTKNEGTKAEAVGEAVGKGIAATGEGVVDAGKAVGTAAATAGRAVGKAAEATAEATTDATAAAAETVRNGGDTTQNAVEQGAERSAEATERAADRTERAAERTADAATSTATRSAQTASDRTANAFDSATRQADRADNTVIAQNTPTTANPVTPGAENRAAAQGDPTGELPQTASPAFLILLAGLASVGGALVLRRLQA